MGPTHGEALGLFVLFGVVLTLAFIFLLLAIYGLVRIRKPGSQGFLVAGFAGFAVCMYLIYHTGYAAMYADLAYENLHIPQKIFLGQFLPIAIIIFPVMAFICLSVVGLIRRRIDKSSSMAWIGCLGTIMALVISVSYAIYGSWHHVQSWEAVIRADVHGLQIAIERYAIDHEGYYPEVIGELYGDYLTEFPINVFTLRPMRNVEYGSPETPGNFTYLPVSVDEKVVGFYLIAYGSEYGDGVMLMGDGQPDHVIIVVNSMEDNPVWPADLPFPEVQEVIQSSMERVVRPLSNNAPIELPENFTR